MGSNSRGHQERQKFCFQRYNQQFEIIVCIIIHNCVLTKTKYTFVRKSCKMTIQRVINVIKEPHLHIHISNVFAIYVMTAALLIVTSPQGC